MTSAYDDRSRRELTERKAVEELLRREPVEARDRVLLDEALAFSCKFHGSLGMNGQLRAGAAR